MANEIFYGYDKEKNIVVFGFFFIGLSALANESNTEIARAFELMTAMTWGNCKAIQSVISVDQSSGGDFSSEQIRDFTGTLTGFQEAPNDNRIHNGRSQVRKFRSPIVAGGSLEKMWSAARESGCGPNHRPGYSWNDQRLTGSFTSKVIQGKYETKLVVDFMPQSTTDCSAAVISALARAGLSPLPYDHPTMKKFKGFRDDNDADSKWMAREWLDSPCFELVDYRAGASCEEGDIILAVDKDLSSGHTAVVTSCGAAPFGNEVDSCNSPNDFSGWSLQIGQVTTSPAKKIATPPTLWSPAAEYAKSGEGRIGQLLTMIQQSKCEQRKNSNYRLPPLEAGDEKFSILRHTHNAQCRYRDPISGNILNKGQISFKREDTKKPEGSGCFDSCLLR